ncbi:MAG: hypothetical protein DYH17_11935 [Xanthomonadales bacterium PRO6]|nr:hypothetical protein [Xanthomonadales bacterium]MCE7932071.1 hypothetical protein [Xanthomonadales bacterium PRO6]
MSRRISFLLASLAFALGAGVSSLQAEPLPDPACGDNCRIEFEGCVSNGGSFRACKAARIACVRACGLTG